MSDINRRAETYNSLRGGDRRTTMIAGAIAVVLTMVMGVAVVVGSASASMPEPEPEDKGWVWDRQPSRFDYGWRMPR